jgi:Spy/CpxP family protein refolding chaperone
MNRSVTLPSAVLALFFALPAAAQHAGHHGAPSGHAPPAANAVQPYAGLEGRRIKALSVEDAAGLLVGRGMALALAAELNGYPGPMHVLEHGDALGLSGAQRAAAEGLRNRMLDEARALGARIVALEEELDRLFAAGTADTGRLAALTASLGALNGRLREVHLATHISMRDFLGPEQRAAYDRMRGYTSGR